MDRNQSEWLHFAKLQLKVRTQERLQERMDHLQKIINAALPANTAHLLIDKSLRDQIIAQVFTTIDEYKGTKKLARNEETSRSDVVDNGRTWWNRAKGHTLGAVLFSVICFYLLYNFICCQCRSLSPKDELILFIDIFQSIMKTEIKFRKTKPKPLIIQQCFLQRGPFKDICANFVDIFGNNTIKWDCYMKTLGVHIENGKRKHQYIKQKNRTEELHQGFYECLTKIKKNLKECKEGNESLQKALDRWKRVIQSVSPIEYDLKFYNILDDDLDGIKKDIKDRQQTSILSTETEMETDIVPRAEQTVNSTAFQGMQTDIHTTSRAERFVSRTEETHTLSTLPQYHTLNTFMINALSTLSQDQTIPVSSSTNAEINKALTLHPYERINTETNTTSVLPQHRTVHTATNSVSALPQYQTINTTNTANTTNRDSMDVYDNIEHGQLAMGYYHKEQSHDIQSSRSAPHPMQKQIINIRHELQNGSNDNLDTNGYVDCAQIVIGEMYQCKCIECVDMISDMNMYVPFQGMDGYDVYFDGMNRTKEDVTMDIVNTSKSGQSILDKLYSLLTTECKVFNLPLKN